MLRTLAIATLSLLTLAGCSPDDGVARSALSEEEATQNAEIMLEGLRDGDYDAYTADFSDDMLSMVTPEVFAEVRGLITDLSGEFVSIDAVKALDAETAGYVRWQFETTFTQEPVTVGVVYEEEGTVIHGVFYDSENIAAASR